MRQRRWCERVGVRRPWRELRLLVLVLLLVLLLLLLQLLLLWLADLHRRGVAREGRPAGEGRPAEAAAAAEIAAATTPRGRQWREATLHRAGRRGHRRQVRTRSEGHHVVVRTAVGRTVRARGKRRRSMRGGHARRPPRREEAARSPSRRRRPERRVERVVVRVVVRTRGLWVVAPIPRHCGGYSRNRAAALAGRCVRCARSRVRARASYHRPKKRPVTRLVYSGTMLFPAKSLMIVRWEPRDPVNQTNYLW